MASNLDYLDPNLQPLEAKVKAYLAAEKGRHKAVADPAATEAHTTTTADVARLHQEILDMLPARETWIVLNLGYGPSRVGAWPVPAAAGQAAHWQVRVVQ